jgi:hypothetical protein
MTGSCHFICSRIRLEWRNFAGFVRTFNLIIETIFFSFNSCRWKSNLSDCSLQNEDYERVRADFGRRSNGNRLKHVPSSWRKIYLQLRLASHLFRAALSFLQVLCFKSFSADNKISDNSKNHSLLSTFSHCSRVWRPKEREKIYKMTLLL